MIFNKINSNDNIDETLTTYSCQSSQIKVIENLPKGFNSSQKSY